MKRNKNNIIFHTNNLLLSAFSDNKALADVLQFENNSLKSKVDKNLIPEYENILKNKKENCFDEFLSARYNYKYNQHLQLFSVLIKSLKTTSATISTIKNLANVLNSLGAGDMVIKFYEKELLANEKNDSVITEILANAYFNSEKYYLQAVEMYEKLINIYKLKRFEYYYKLAFLYERIYQDKMIDKQIEYAIAASKMENNNMINIFLAKLYYRKGLKNECEKYSKRVLNNNPTPEQIVSYSRFLMQDGKIKESYDLYRCRFKTNNVAYPDVLTDETRWNGKDDLSNSTVIIHYEQGFGDTIMFARYIPTIAAMAKKVILVVQKNIIPVLKASGFDQYCEILSHEADINPNIKLDNANASVMYSAGTGMSKIPHDYHIPMLDLPYLIGENPDRMKEAGGYLTADIKKINEFEKKYIKNKKHLKIGIAYRGSKESEVTYRDISINEFLPLLEIKNVDLYLFQADLKENELENIDKSRIFDISKFLKDFGDTAAAISSMDLIISTDNVVMNLAGAMAHKTYGLFNIYPESRWYKTSGDNIGWYKSVKPFKVSTFNDWGNLMNKVKKQIEKDFN